MSRYLRITWLEVVCLIASCLIIASTCHGQTCTGVIDGQTLRLDDGRTVRIRGVDAPGPDAVRHLKWWLLDRPITLSDVQVGAWGQVTADVRWRGLRVAEQMANQGLAQRTSSQTMFVVPQPIASHAAPIQTPQPVTIYSAPAPVYGAPTRYYYRQPVYRYARPMLRSSCPGGVCPQ